MLKTFFYDWAGLNLWLFHAINNLRGVNLDKFMRLGTALGDHRLFWFYLALLIVLQLWLREKYPATNIPSPAAAHFIALNVFVTVYFIDTWLVGWLKQQLGFPRPGLALAPKEVHVLVHEHDLHHSLPSGHAVFAVTLVSCVWPSATRRQRVGWIGFALWVGISRINLGAHFPADVLAGSLLAVVTVIAVRYLLEGVVRSRQPSR
ncbi:MAG: phosphatase PAP2 family protein [Gammaproteobacteria bacterium]|nr:phosphatase PAP2 family protein [Gammaproteobacteria bacterium]